MKETLHLELYKLSEMPSASFLNSHIEQPRYVFSNEEITWVEGQWSIVVLSVIIVMSCFLNQYTWYFHLYKNNILKNILVTPHREKFLRKLYKNKYINFIHWRNANYM